MTLTTYGLPDLAYVIFDGVDIVGITTGMNDEIVNPTEDITVAGEAIVHEKFIGLQEGSVTFNGFYDSVLNAALQKRASGVLMYAPMGNTRGAYVSCVASAVPLAPQRNTESKAFTKASLTWNASGSASVIDNALLVAPLAARATAGNLDATYVDLGATASSGVRFYVSCTALTLGGYTNVKPILRHCATSGGAYADIAASVATFTAVGGYYVAVTSSVNRYLSVGWSWTGSGTGQSATFTAAAAAI